jgi:large subunit ribosomal protein L5
MARLQEKYNKEIVPKLVKELKLKSSMQVPRIMKIVVASGLGKAIENPKLIDIAVENIATITGQRPVVTKSKAAVSSFKLRANQPIGVKVTLRKQRMYEFFDRLVNAAMARIKDFRGISPKAFDQTGNLNIGIREHTIFPEISFENTEQVHGLQVTIVFNSDNTEHNQRLMQELGLPFAKTAQ